VGRRAMAVRLWRLQGENVKARSSSLIAARWKISPTPPDRSFYLATIQLGGVIDALDRRESAGPTLLALTDEVIE
jgi:hypothetical protein